MAFKCTYVEHVNIGTESSNWLRKDRICLPLGFEASIYLFNSTVVLKDQGGSLVAFAFRVRAKEKRTTDVREQ